MANSHHLTKWLKRAGQPQFALWHFVAGNGMWLFVVFASFAIAEGWLTWWHAVLPVMVAYPVALLLENLVQRDRPRDDKKADYKLWFRTFSFPSGHATASAAWAVTLVGLTTFPNPTMQIVAGVAFGLLTVAVGVSRVIVGVHYVSDVLAGFIVGGIFGAAYLVVASF